VTRVDVAQRLDRLEDVRELCLQTVHLLVTEVETRETRHVKDVVAADGGHGPMVACGPMPVTAIPIRDGTIEAYALGDGAGTPLVVLGGVETGFRPLAGTESVLDRRWSERGRRRRVMILGRPIPDDPADAELVMHPRVIADGVATALDVLGLGAVAIEAESGGGRISLWLTVDHPERVERLVLAAVASERHPTHRWPSGWPMDRARRGRRLGHLLREHGAADEGRDRGGVRVVRGRRRVSSRARRRRSGSSAS
jgi:pimeloyl-ACP methyl ester carboxylesterase